jgi:hypothetical protein
VQTINVRAETQEGEHDAVVVVTLESTSWQLNLRASPTDWERLSQVPGADWDRREAVRLGTLEGAAVWWHVSGDALYLAIGDGGPESSDLGFVLPLWALGQVRDEVANVDEGWG